MAEGKEGRIDKSETERAERRRATRERDDKRKKRRRRFSRRLKDNIWRYETSFLASELEAVSLWAAAFQQYLGKVDSESRSSKDDEDLSWIDVWVDPAEDLVESLIEIPSQVTEHFLDSWRESAKG